PVTLQCRLAGMTAKPEQQSPGCGPLQREPEKLCQRVAASIEREVIACGWQVGFWLGTEKELATRHGVSRWTMREAISIAELDGLITVKRGRGGGILVAAPALDAVSSAARPYLLACRIAPHQFIAA